jgi:hypothetical protein
MNLYEYRLYGTLSHLPSKQIKAIYYFHDRPLTCSEFCNTQVAGFIQSIWCPITKVLTIQYVSSRINGIGLAYALMAACIEDGQRAGMETVELDDMSDRFMQDHNLYVNMGFAYTSEGSPEMVAQTELVLNIWEDMKVIKRPLDIRRQSQNWEEDDNTPIYP